MNLNFFNGSIAKITFATKSNLLILSMWIKAMKILKNTCNIRVFETEEYPVSLHFIELN